MGQLKYKFPDFFGICGCPEYFERIILQSFDPCADIRRMLTWIMTHPKLTTEHQARDLGAQFFLCIPFTTERV